VIIEFLTLVAQRSNVSKQALVDAGILELLQTMLSHHQFCPSKAPASSSSGLVEPRPSSSSDTDIQEGEDDFARRQGLLLEASRVFFGNQNHLFDVR
jgi:hypothetical protein